MTVFYHYTCEHAAKHIRRDRRLIPHGHQLLPMIPPIVWLTDLPTCGGIERRALGLTSYSLACDRTLYRVTVELDTPPLWWPRWAKTAIHKQHKIGIETSIGGLMPMHWYLTLGEHLPIVDIAENPGYEPADQIRTARSPHP